jgi:hypothetical protein
MIDFDQIVRVAERLNFGNWHCGEELACGNIIRKLSFEGDIMFLM